jgi:hypothetical protein
MRLLSIVFGLMLYVISGGNSFAFEIVCEADKWPGVTVQHHKGSFESSDDGIRFGKTRYVVDNEFKLIIKNKVVDAKVVHTYVKCQHQSKFAPNSGVIVHHLRDAEGCP